MINTQFDPDFGLRPVLFKIGGVDIETYPVFMALGLVAGLVTFAYYAKREKQFNEHSFQIVLWGIIGGIIGSKLPLWIAYAPEIWRHLPDDVSLILSGRTIVGGIIGGAIGVAIVKRKLGIKQRVGNAIAPALAISIAIGRWGCVFRGCAYGIATDLACGIDFGDGIPRHPTQIYESIFCLFLFGYFVWRLRGKPRDGVLFREFVIVYFTFRFFIEFIRVEEKVLWGLSAYQFAAIFAIMYYSFKTYYFDQKGTQKVEKK